MLPSIIGIIGEFGGDIQMSLNENTAIFIGGGYDITYPVYNPQTNAPGYSLAPSGGYTIRVGEYVFFKKQNYISLQFFYRKWLPTTVFDYGGGPSGNGPTTDYADNYQLLNGISGDESATAGYCVEKCSITVATLDLLYGKQILKGNQKHFLFEWYIGIGVRFKTIYTEQFGQFGQGGLTFSTGPYLPYTPPINSISNSSSFDFKLGIMLGYKL